MRKLWTFLLAATFSVIGGYSATAGVRFITDVPYNTIESVVSSSASESGQSRCAAAGYTKTVDSCSRGKIAVRPCPYNSRYFKACCEPQYKHSKEYCYKKGKTPSRHSCAGMYACE